MAEADTEAVVVAVRMEEAEEVASTVAVEAADSMAAVSAEEAERIAVAADRMEVIVADRQAAQAEVRVPTGEARAGMRRADTVAELTVDVQMAHMAERVQMAHTAVVRPAIRGMRVTAVPDRMRGVRIR
jgi:hypothetical protein